MSSSVLSRTLGRTVLAIAVLSVSACGLIKDRSGEYASAVPGKPLEVPDGYSDHKISARYPIPEMDRKVQLDEDFELPKPPNATAALRTEPYLVETIGGQTWLRLYSSPGKIWPLLDFYWQENSVSVDQQLIQQGIVLTQAIPQSSPLYEVLAQHGSTSSSASLKARLTQGVRRNTAELQIRVVTPGLDLATETWSDDQGNSELERALLDSIGKFLSAEEQRNRHSLLANDIGGEPRVFLMDDEAGGSFLQLKLSYLRAWSEIGKALKASEVLVSDVDQSSGKYFVSYLSAEELDSWFLTEEGRKEKLQERNFEVEIIEDKKSAEITHEVRVKALNDKFDDDAINELLVVIFEHIS